MANMMPYYNQSMTQPFFRQPCGCSGSGVYPYANPYGNPMAAANTQAFPMAQSNPVAGMGTGGKTLTSPATAGKTGALGSNTGTGKSPKVLYKAKKEAVEQIRKIKEEAAICNQYVNHHVRVETIDGQTHEGTIAGMDHHTLYLQPQQSMRYPYPYYSPYPYYNPYSAVLPLVLFDLLAITLL